MDFVTALSTQFQLKPWQVQKVMELIDEGKEIEMNCHFCNKNYIFTVEELKNILKACRK